MRAGACTVQQTLTLEAASVLKHSLSLARRRGHAQVTPLHVAATLLGYRASLLRRACLRSHPHPTSHPLQCRALELCFNVALNRLPTIPGPVLHGQPSLSNALVAALKRAQAHQRRGCIEQQQQQPLLAIKVELEQLIISILDDPSVSRVMREAGFSSTCVKNNLEDSSVSSLFQCYSSAGVLLPSSSPTAEPTRSDIISHSGFWQTHFLNSSTDQSSRLYPTPKKHFTSTPLMDSDTYKAEDLRLVLEVLLSKKRRNNTVVVGDCVSSTEGLVLELMGRLERGEVPEELRSAHFIKFQLSSVSLLRFIKRDEVETKISDLRRKVSSVSPGGAIIYVGDLKWAVEATHIEKEEVFTVGDVTDYNPVHHVIAEIGRLLYDFSVSNRKVWLMATANYQTYMRCQMKQPPLEVQWSLQAVAVPSGGLALSLHAPSSVDSRVAVLQNPSQTLESVTSNNMDEHEKHICCAECNSNFEKEAGIFNSSQQNSSSLLSCNDLEENDKGPCHLPYWLKQNRTENHPKDFVLELKRKWNRLCQSLHHPRRDQIHLSPSLLNPTVGGKNNSYPSPHPWWSTSLQHNHSNNKVSDLNSISIEAESTSKPNSSFNFVAQLTNEQPQSVEIAVGDGNRKEANAHKHQPSGMSLDSLNKIQNKEAKITFSLGNPLFSDSKTTNQGNRGPIDPQDLCRAMLENVPWQSEIIPSIAEALLDCESNTNKGTWLLIKGSDWMGKRRLARVIAQSYCRTGDKLVHMNMRRKENVVSCVETLMDSLRTGDNCVILVEEIDFSDTNFVEFLAHAFNSGNCKDQIGGRELDFSHAIIILTTNTSTNFDEESNAVIKMQLQVEEMKNWSEVSKNAKRKAEWDLVYPSGNLRTEKKEDPLIVEENTSTKGQFSRQSSSSNLDLNILAEEHEEKELEKPDKCFAVTPDPTNQTLLHHSTAHGFLKLIEKSFIFDRNCFQYSQMSKNFLSKLNNSFEEVYGCERKGWISIDQKLLQEVMDASATFVNSLFEKWLKEVFQKSLLMVQNVQKSVRVRLCPIVGGKQEDILDSGFEGTSLPERIQIVFKD